MDLLGGAGNAAEVHDSLVAVDADIQRTHHLVGYERGLDPRGQRGVVDEFAGGFLRTGAAGKHQQHEDKQGAQ